MNASRYSRYSLRPAVVPTAGERWIAGRLEADGFGPGPVHLDDDGEGLLDVDLVDEAVDFDAAHARDWSTDAECAEAALAMREHLFLRQCEAVAAIEAPRDCPACTGAGRGCGICGGLGWVAGAEWVTAVQRAFVGACGLVLAHVPCDDDDDDLERSA